MRLAKLNNSPFIYFNYTAWISWITLILIVFEKQWHSKSDETGWSRIQLHNAFERSWTRDKSWSMLWRLTEEFVPLPTISDEMVLVHWTHSRRTKTAGPPKYGTWCSVMARVGVFLNVAAHQKCCLDHASLKQFQSGLHLTSTRVYSLATKKRIQGRAKTSRATSDPSNDSTKKHFFPRELLRCIRKHASTQLLFLANYSGLQILQFRWLRSQHLLGKKTIYKIRQQKPGMVKIHQNTIIKMGYLPLMAGISPTIGWMALPNFIQVMKEWRWLPRWSNHIMAEVGMSSATEWFSEVIWWWSRASHWGPDSWLGTPEVFIFPVESCLDNAY